MKENGQPSIDVTTKRMVAVNRIMDGILEMRNPEGSEKYKHGKLQFDLGRLDAAVLGLNPNEAIDKAQERVREYDELQHRALDHRLKVQEDRDIDWKIIRGEFPNQFEEFEEQAKQGEVPVFRSDAGGFEMKKHGW